MMIKLIEGNGEKISTTDLVSDLRKSRKIDYSGAIFTFEGIVRGKDGGKSVDKLILRVNDKQKALEDIENIAESVKIKYNVFDIAVVHHIGEFYTGDSLFLVAVLGNHRKETLDALNEVIDRVKHEVDFIKEEISNEGTKTILAGG